MTNRVIIEDTGGHKGKVLRINGKYVMAGGLAGWHRAVGIHTARGKVLDIGTGMGEFLEMANENANVADIESVDIIPEVIDWVKANRKKSKVSKWHSQDINEFIQSPPPQKWDFILLDLIWSGRTHTLQQMVDEAEAIADYAWNNLKKDGGFVAYHDLGPYWNLLKPILEAKGFVLEHHQIPGNTRSRTGYYDIYEWKKP